MEMKSFKEMFPDLKIEIIPCNITYTVSFLRPQLPCRVYCDDNKPELMNTIENFLKGNYNE